MITKRTKRVFDSENNISNFEVITRNVSVMFNAKNLGMILHFKRRYYVFSITQSHILLIYYNLELLRPIEAYFCKAETNTSSFVCIVLYMIAHWIKEFVAIGAAFMLYFISVCSGCTKCCAIYCANLLCFAVLMLFLSIISLVVFFTF